MKLAKNAESRSWAASGADVGDVLIGSNDDDATVGTVDASAVEDVWTVMQVRAEDLFVVDEPQPARSRQEQRRHGVDSQVSVVLLADRTYIDRRVDIVAGGCSGPPVSRDSPRGTYRAE